MTKLNNQSTNQFDNELLALNLQFFAEEADTTTTTTKDSGKTDAEDAKAGAETKALTQDDVLKLIQSETDKVRTEYSNKLKGKDKELEDLRIEKMTEDEKKTHHQSAMEEENAKLKKDALRYVAIEQLAKHSMPVEVVEFVVADNAEATTERITKFKAIFDKAVADKAGENFKNRGTQHQTGVGAGSTVTKAQFNAMGLTDRTTLQRENPELYNTLLKL